ADGAQSSRVPASFPKDPYEVIRQACLVETDTEFEPSEDLIDTETPGSPHVVASPTPLPNSTSPACHTEESEDSDTSGARSTSSDSTAPLSPDHPLTRTSPTPTPTRASFHHRTEDTDEDEGYGLDDEGHGLDDEGHRGTGLESRLEQERTIPCDILELYEGPCLAWEAGQGMLHPDGKYVTYGYR
ncbi:hypothetical protein Tco_1298997, partial [Tanacetum coccineum]